MYFLVWLFLEIFLFAKSVEWFGWMNSFLIYFGPSLIGAILLSSISRVGLMAVQGALSKGQVPGTQLLHTGAVFVGFLLLVVPTFTTRLLGICLILPGLRHLLVWRFKIFATQKMAQGSAQFFSFGAGAGAGGFKFYNYQAQGGSGGVEKDVTPASQDILDVTPLKVTHGEKLESSGPSENKDS